MDLKAAVQKYRDSVGGFGEPMPLARFGLPRAETEAMLSAWDDDYHLHRHFELVPSSWLSPGEAPYSINGALYTAIVFRETICDVLD